MIELSQDGMEGRKTDPTGDKDVTVGIIGHNEVSLGRVDLDGSADLQAIERLLKATHLILNTNDSGGDPRLTLVRRSSDGEPTLDATIVRVVMRKGVLALLRPAPQLKLSGGSKTKLARHRPLEALWLLRLTSP